MKNKTSQIVASSLELEGGTTGQMDLRANNNGQVNGNAPNQQHSSPSPGKGNGDDMYAFAAPDSKGATPHQPSNANNGLNQTQEAGAGEGSLQDITQGDHMVQPRNLAKLKEDNGPALGNPLDYNLYDLFDRDKENGKLKCCSVMQRGAVVCSTLCFLAAIAVSFVLSLKPEYTAQTVNSYISPEPLKEKEIDIHDFGLNYLIYLRKSKNDNKAMIKESKGSRRRLNVAFDNVEDLKNYGAEAITDDEMVSELCNGIRLAIRQETEKGTTIFLSDCRTIELKTDKKSMDGRVLVYNSFEKYKAVKLEDNTPTEDLDIVKLLNMKTMSDTKMLFKNDQFTSQSLLILHNTKNLKKVTPYKQYIFSSEAAHHKIEPQVKLDKYQEKMTNSKKSDSEKVVALIKELMKLPSNKLSSFDYSKIEELIQMSNIVLKIRTEQEFGTKKIRPKQINYQLFKNVTKGDTKADDVVNDSGFSYEQLNSFMHLQDVNGGGSNGEFPMVVDFNELIFEQEAYTGSQYMSNVGSYLVLFCTGVVIIFGTIGMIFVSVFISELKQLVHKKYEEQKYLHGIQKYMKKFNTIHLALLDKRNEPEYREIFVELDSVLNTDVKNMGFNKIKALAAKMHQLDTKLPNIEDVEDMLSAVRFEQPAMQKLMDQKINKIVTQRSELTPYKIGQLIKKRLSLYSLFMLQDNFELNTVKMKAEMHIQNEKLEFLFKTLAERSERRTTRKRIKQNQEEEEEE